MTIALWVTVTVIIILSFIVVAFVFRKREKIPCMTGMMIAMTLGMMVGLVAGVILGVILTGNLFLSTLLSMGVGIMIGFIAGAPISVMAVLDGMLAGLMGGMMGAMLGEMIASGYQDMIIKIMFVIFVCMVFILLFMMQQELTSKRENTKDSLFHNPLFMLLILGIFFFGYNQLGSTILISDNRDQKENQHEGHQMDRSQDMQMKNDTGQDNGNEITILAKEFLYSPNQVRLRQGERVTLILQNQGEMEHDLEIVGLDAEMTAPTESHTSYHQVNRNTVHIHADPGKQQSISFIPQRPGLYKMLCNIPGHSGMQGWIKVT